MQITDYGRLTLDPKSNWSLTWRIEEGKPILLWSYLGPLIAEISYQLSGASGAGSRIAALLGGMFAATMAFGWLKSLKVSVYAAFGLSLAFLIDPLFILSQRIGRMDSWVIGFCLASCYILNKTAQDRKASKAKLMFAGALAIVAGLTWPSAVFLYPLIILELIRPSLKVKGFTTKSKIILFNLGYFGLGGLIIGSVLLIPIWENIMIILADMSTMVSRNVDGSKSIFEKLIAFFDYEVWFKLIKAFIKTLSIFLPLLALGGLLFRREKGAIIVTLLTIAAIFTSLVYEFRALYLLPYFLLLAGTLFLEAKRKENNLLVRRIANSGLVILILWSVGISLVVRTSLGLENRSDSHLDKIYNAASSTIGEGAYKVFLGFNYEFYFAGRSLDWHLYCPYVKYEYDEEGNWISDSKYEPSDKFIDLLSTMDYAIFKESEVDSELSIQIASSGLKYRKILFPRDNDLPGENEFKSRTEEILMWYLNGGDTDASYIIYSRQKPEYTEKLKIAQIEKAGR